MTVRPACPDDFEEIVALVRKTFPSLPQGVARQFHLNDPWGKPEHSRVAVIDGRIASHVRIVKRPIRLGSATLWLGGIAAVGTLPKFRGRGGASACLVDALRYMREHGMALSMLFTDIHPFYERLGYQVLPVTSFSFPIPPRHTGGAPLSALGDTRTGPGPTFAIRQAEPERDLPFAAAIYDRFNENRAFALVRTLEYWRAWRTWAVWEAYLYETPEAFLIAERDGQPVAYSRAKLAPGGRPFADLLEMCCLPGHEPACLALFLRTCELARAREFPALTAQIPTDHPLVGQLSQAGLPGERHIISNRMVRVVHLRTLLEAVLPDLSRFCRAQGKWALRVGDESVTLQCREGTVELSDATAAPAVLGPTALLALLAGHDVPPTPDVEALRRDCPELLEVLSIGRHFPAPAYWSADDF